MTIKTEKGYNVGKPRKYNDDGSEFIPEPKPKVKIDLSDIEPDYSIKSIPRTPEVKETKNMANKIGNFIVVNTIGLKGLRINLSRITSYAPNGDISIGIAWDNSTQPTILKFNTTEEMFKVLEQMDAACL